VACRTPPDSRSIAVAKKKKILIFSAKGRQFKADDFNDFDYIYVMDKSNYDDVLALAKMIKKRESSIILNELFPNENVDVPDPFMAWQMALKWYTTC
jgi:protein-tyrosine phosphatase